PRRKRRRSSRNYLQRPVSMPAPDVATRYGPTCLTQVQVLRGQRMRDLTPENVGITTTLDDRPMSGPCTDMIGARGLSKGHLTFRRKIPDNVRDRGIVHADSR